MTAFRSSLLSLFSLGFPLSLALGLVACDSHEASVEQPGIAITPPGFSTGFIAGGGLGGLAGSVDGGTPVRLAELRTAARTPPAISGGTLAVDKAGTVAVVADSDRDLVYVVDLKSGGVQKVKLAEGAASRVVSHSKAPLRPTWRCVAQASSHASTWRT